MANTITFTEADQALVIAILNQIETGKIDNEKLRRDLNLPTRNTASQRLSRFKAKLAAAKGATAPLDAPGKPDASGKEPRTSRKKRKMNAEVKEENNTTDADDWDEGTEFWG